MLTSVFKIQSYTRNVESCDREGPSILADLGQELFVYTYAYDKGEGAALVTCDSVEACRAKASDYRERQVVPQTKLMAPFIEAVDESHRKGFLIDTGLPKRDGGCKEAKSTTTELRLRGDELTFILRGVQGDLPRDEKNRCTTMQAKSALTGRDCNYYQVLKATHVSTL